MTLVDTVGRIQQIQSTLTRLSTPVTAPATAEPAAPASSTSSASTGYEGPSRAFADALAAAASGAAPTTSTAAVSPAGAVAAPARPMATGEATSSDVVAAANKYVGVPYVWGGTDPAVGMDCSGFTQRVYRDLGIELPRVTWDQMKMGTEVPSLAEAQPGDLLFSLDGGHVSIYLGDNKVIDAPQPGKTITVRDAWENDGNIDAIRRIVPTDSGAAAESSPAGPSPSADGAALADLVAAAQAAFVSGRP